MIEANRPVARRGRARASETISFPARISGQELAARAYDQAHNFAAKILIAKTVAGSTADTSRTRVFRRGGGRAAAHAPIIIASGWNTGRWRRNRRAFEGAACTTPTRMEAHSDRTKPIAVVGGATPRPGSHVPRADAVAAHAHSCDALAKTMSLASACHRASASTQAPPRILLQMPASCSGPSRVVERMVSMRRDSETCFRQAVARMTCAPTGGCAGHGCWRGVGAAHTAIASVRAELRFHAGGRSNTPAPSNATVLDPP